VATDDTNDTGDVYDAIFKDDRLYTKRDAVEKGAFGGPSSVDDAVRDGRLSPGTKPGFRRLFTGLELKTYLRAGRHPRPDSPEAA
jgi:hypothetical protein